MKSPFSELKYSDQKKKLHELTLFLKLLKKWYRRNKVTHKLASHLFLNFNERAAN